MTYNEKRTLYESIMKKVAKTVKRIINESFEVPDMDNEEEFLKFFRENNKKLNIIDDILKHSREISKEHPNETLRLYIKLYCYDDIYKDKRLKSFLIGKFKNGRMFYEPRPRRNYNLFMALHDDCFQGETNLRHLSNNKPEEQQMLYLCSNKMFFIFKINPEKTESLLELFDDFFFMYED